MDNKEIYNYILRLSDNCLILGQRLAEWCGHGPVLEQDIAMTNISLDLIGQARNYYQYASELAEEGKSEDDIAFLRVEKDYFNLLLVEQPNGNFANTVIRQYLFDVFHYAMLEELSHSGDEQLAAIAQKSLKEVAYHKRWSSQWVLRLGDGTEESHAKMQEALEEAWPFAFEGLIPDELDQSMLNAGIGVNLEKIAPSVKKEVDELLKEATLTVPESDWSHSGGKTGRHTENLGHILAEMQYMQRAYPNSEW